MCIKIQILVFNSVNKKNPDVLSGLFYNTSFTARAVYP